MSTTLFLTRGLLAAISVFAFRILPAEPPSPENADGPIVRIDVCIVQIPAGAVPPGDGAGKVAARDIGESAPPGNPAASTSCPDGVADVVALDPRRPAADGSMQVELMRDGSCLQVGSRRFIVAKAHLQPEGADTADADAMDVIAAPSIRARVGERAAITIGQAVSYMQKLDNGDLRLVVDNDCVEGVEVEALVSEVKEGLIHLDSLSVGLNTIERRERIDGVPFDVGRPVVQTRQVSCSLRMAEGNTAVVPLPVSAAHASTVLLLISMHAEGGEQNVP